MGSSIRFSTFPRTEPPPSFVENVIAVFRKYEKDIATENNDKGLKSDDVLALLGPDLREIGFQVEASKKKVDKLQRPVFFGENGNPTLRYEIDAYHEGWRCGLEVEAGRGWMGNAVYRDLIQAAVMGSGWSTCAWPCATSTSTVREANLPPAGTTRTLSRWPKLFTATAGYVYRITLFLSGTSGTRTWHLLDQRKWRWRDTIGANSATCNWAGMPNTS